MKVLGEEDLSLLNACGTRKEWDFGPFIFQLLAQCLSLCSLMELLVTFNFVDPLASFSGVRKGPLLSENQRDPWQHSVGVQESTKEKIARKGVHTIEIV